MDAEGEKEDDGYDKRGGNVKKRGKKGLILIERGQNGLFYLENNIFKVPHNHKLTDVNHCHRFYYICTGSKS